MPSKPLTTPKLRSLNIYRQAPLQQPRATPIPKRTERVEVMIAGNAQVCHEGEWVAVRAGDILWHVPGDYTIGRSDPQQPYACLNMIFASALPTGTRRVPHITRWPDVLQVRSFTDEALEYWTNPHFPKGVVAQFLFGTLLYRAHAWALQLQRQSLPAPVQAALTFMEARFADPLKVDAIAAAVGVSAPYLTELFRKHYHLSPHQCLRSIRMRAASYRLASGNAPIKQIAAECGFSTASAFCAAFQAEHAISPAAFRLSLR